MQLPGDAARRGEDGRASGCEFVELHVLYVPDDQWNVKLNKVPAEATESFISAGFIRVHPDVTLKALRGELGTLLGAERSVREFCFLRCVGRSLALVKGRQERDLKVKTFAPPYAAQPELYLLPAPGRESSADSQPLTPDTSSSSSDHRTRRPPRTWGPPAETKKPVKFPHIAGCSRQPPPTSSLEEEEEEDEDEGEDERGEELGYSSSEAEGADEEGVLSSDKPEWEEKELHPRRPRSRRVAARQLSRDPAPVPESPGEETCRKEELCGRRSSAARDSGVAESLEERGSGLSLTDRCCAAGGPRRSSAATRSESTSSTTAAAAASDGVCEGGLHQRVADADAATVTGGPGPVRGTAPPSGPDPTVLQTNRDAFIEEIKLTREERKQLERRRQELLRKGKDLLAQNRNRRNEARDSWKKRYFDTKKATAPLEDTLRNLQQQLEILYNKLLHQLHARDNRGKPRRQGRPCVKNELIIQIVTESREIDHLKRKMEDAKMKLLTEIKLRKQAATELRALKAELAQKKSQSSHPGSLAFLGFLSTRNGAQVQSSSL